MGIRARLSTAHRSTVVSEPVVSLTGRPHPDLVYPAAKICGGADVRADGHDAPRSVRCCSRQVEEHSASAA